MFRVLLRRCLKATGREDRCGRDLESLAWLCWIGDGGRVLLGGCRFGAVVGLFGVALWDQCGRRYEVCRDALELNLTGYDRA